MEKNKMAVVPLKKLFLKMGLPMIISMVLQALYNVIDSIFITNMGSDGVIANQALTLAFPIQLLIIAIGVGTGVGINALLSKSLGEQNKDKVNKIAGTGIFLSICIYVVFLVFGLFGSEKFIRLFAGSNQKVIEMGTTYLKICCCFSYGSIGFTVYERFLQSTGKTHFFNNCSNIRSTYKYCFRLYLYLSYEDGRCGSRFSNNYWTICFFICSNVFSLL